jgi:peptide/nickel transport system permease protein
MVNLRRMGWAFMTLRTYIIRRILVVIPIFLLISVLVFFMVHAAPGDPSRILIGERSRVPPEIRDEFIKRLGLDQPVHVQYFLWLGRFLQGDLGYSFLNNKPVIAIIGERVQFTLELMIAAEIISVVVAVILGVIAAVKHYSVIDGLTSLIALIGYSTPNFWLAMMLILVFGLQWKLLPVGGTKTVGIGFATPLNELVDHLRHLVLPVTVLVLVWTAYLFRMVRTSMLEVLGQDYITTARAKGLKERVVIYKHALRNALLPVITYEGYSIGYLFAGAAVIEYVFNWTGLGHFIVEMTILRDYPSVIGISMIIAVMVLLANLIADIAYALADPRIRYD